MLNDLVRRLGLLDMPLSDRMFTWSNKQQIPILAKLDRFLISNSWGLLYPNAVVSSFASTASDHIPIFLNCITDIPSSQVFRFNNHWTLYPFFLPLVNNSWASVHASRSGLPITQHISLCLKPTRADLKAWSKTLRCLDVVLTNCQLVIGILSTLEEHQPLSHAEFTLGRLVLISSRRQSARIAAYWRQRGKVQRCLPGDDNTKYHHMCATIQMRGAPIRMLLDSNHEPVYSHQGKEQLLLQFYKGLMGSPDDCALLGDISRFTDGQRLDTHQATALAAPFTESEVKTAVFSMKADSAPGPDGFGAKFYQINWTLVKSSIMEFMQAFHEGGLSLRGINKSVVVLLPKRDAVDNTKDFRPISLQNCLPKLASKCMMTRLQKFIQSLIHADQTGFIQGRSIAENFICATELVQCCHKRKVPAVVLKLDFLKAFDSVDWSALDTILAAKGFPECWRAWVRQLNLSNQSAILLNGAPSKWFTCKKGLRQGDPLSPYLFILVADILQQIILEASTLQHVHHPLCPDLPCPVLQYADDTLIIMEACPMQLSHLKTVL